MRNPPERGKKLLSLFRPVSRLSRHLNALRRGFHMPFALVFILIIVPGDSPNFWSFLGPIGMEGTLLLWWGATGSSDQRNCPLLPASQVLRHPEVSSEIQLLCCKRLLEVFSSSFGKHITQVGRSCQFGSEGSEQNPTSVASVPDWVDAAPSWSRMMESLCGLKLREASGTFGEVALGLYPALGPLYPFFGSCYPFGLYTQPQGMRSFGQVAQGRSTQLLGCNTLFHGAPGTFGEVTQGRRTHSIYCYIIILAVALCFCNLHYSCFWVGWSAGHHSQFKGKEMPWRSFARTFEKCPNFGRRWVRGFNTGGSDQPGRVFECSQTSSLCDDVTLKELSSYFGAASSKECDIRKLVYRLSLGMLPPRKHLPSSRVIELQIETKNEPPAQDVHIRVEGTSRKEVLSLRATRLEDLSINFEPTGCPVKRIG